MIYEKATAEVILFDNSDVIRTSNCNGHSANKVHGECTGNGNQNHGGPGNKNSYSRANEQRYSYR